MADYAIPKNGAAYIFYTGLVSQTDTKTLKSSPTLAAGDFKVSIDGGALANLATLPTNTPGGVMVKISLSGAEMTGDNITVVCIDAAGAEWCDQIINIQTSARGVADLAYPATSGRSMVVDASGLVDANAVKVGPTGAGTAQTARDIGASVLLSSGTGTGQLDFTSGVVKANVTQYGGSAGTFASGRPEVNTTHLAGQAVTAAAGVTFPTSVASPTNITAGTITTVTNLTNAATAGDFTTTMKTSIGTAVAASAVASVTGNVGGNVTGSVGSVATGGIAAASFAAGAIDAAAIAADAIGASELAATAVSEIAAAISIPSAATIADAVWDELLSGHLTDGSFGAYVNGLALNSGLAFSATSTTIRLDQATASATSDTYNGCWVVVTSGTGIGQVRLIYDYVGSSKQCLVSPAWTTTPAGNDNYVVVPAASINAVYGAVGSVAGNVDGSVATATALGVQAKADVNAEVVDALATDTYAEPGQGTPAATLSLSAKIGYLFKAWRNKSTQTATAYNLYNDDAATVDQKATASDDGTTFSRTEITTGP